MRLTIAIGWTEGKMNLNRGFCGRSSVLNIGVTICPGMTAVVRICGHSYLWKRR